jgi:hypothetical protein
LAQSGAGGMSWAKHLEQKMKLFAILAVVATIALPALPAAATAPYVSCQNGPDTTNNQSSLSSTSASTQSCTVFDDVQKKG